MWAFASLPNVGLIAFRDSGRVKKGCFRKLVLTLCGSLSVGLLPKGSQYNTNSCSNQDMPIIKPRGESLTSTSLNTKLSLLLRKWLNLPLNRACALEIRFYVLETFFSKFKRNTK